MLRDALTLTVVIALFVVMAWLLRHVSLDITRPPTTTTTTNPLGLPHPIGLALLIDEAHQFVPLPWGLFGRHP